MIKFLGTSSFCVNSIAAIVLSGCTTSTPAGIESALPAFRKSPTLDRSDRTGSSKKPRTYSTEEWILPDAKNKTLLYVSNASHLAIYSYPKGKFEGTIGGLNIAGSDCVDSQGDIYVANGSPSRIYEYAHGGRKRIRTLVVPPLPLGCAVDPLTGDLAVATLGTGGNSGSLSVFKNARGTPSDYTLSPFMEYYFCAYDNLGNLFVDGQSKSNAFEFAELPKGAGQLKLVTLDQDIGWPGGIQWDGNYLAVGDQHVPNIYRFSISGSQGTEVGSTSIGGDANDIAQFYIDGGTVLAPNACLPSKCSWGSELIFARYPSGGEPIKERTKGLDGDFGAVISRPSE